ncbi:hypothetical protein LSAT2_023695 [Lamellibrachia satsuma]|nr:hypothetical protein LSAT2_023695 [Lamellibrachia satsuma]
MGWTWFFFYILLAGCQVNPSTGSPCIRHAPKMRPRRHFYMNGQSLPITIETSDRASQQLSSHILRILLTEVLGYEKVEIRSGYNSMNATHILNRIAGCNASCHLEPRMAVPQTMVNLEVWMHAGFNLEPWLKYQQLVNFGPLGPTGRFGWFLPVFTAEKNWVTSQYIVDNWRALKLDAVTSQFMLNDKHGLIKNYLTHRDKSSNLRYCSGGSCTNGIFHGRQCQHYKNKCALLLTSYPELDMGVLQSQINSLHLDVSVAWIGPHLHSFVHQRTVNYLATLFFNWMPNTLTAMGNYSRISFPHCKVVDERPQNCDFEVSQLMKVMWTKIRTHAPEAYHVISHMAFTQDQYEDLLRLYVGINPQYANSDLKLEEAACKWVRHHGNVWHQWMPKNLMTKKRIYLGGMFPLRGPYWRQPGIVPGAQMALEFINQDPDILSEYELVLLIQDTQCKTDLVIKQFLYYLVNDTNPIAGILGPGCSEAAKSIAGISKHFNTVTISQNGAIYLKLFKQFDWQQVALLAEDGQDFPQYHRYLHDLFVNNDVAVVYRRKILSRFSDADITANLEGIRAVNAKIIIVTGFEHLARILLCEAYKQGMTSTNGYVWFLPTFFTDTWWHSRTLHRHQNAMLKCNALDMELAVQGYWALSYLFFGPEQVQIVGNLSVKQWQDVYRKKLNILGIEKYDSPYAKYAYDAVWTFALGLNELLVDDPSALQSLHTDHTSKQFAKELTSVRFSGASGPVEFQGADRTGIINVHQYVGNRSRQIGQYKSNKQNKKQQLTLDLSAIFWLGGERPSDGRQDFNTCTMESWRAFLHTDCDAAIAIANVLGIVLFGVIMLLSLVAVKRRYDMKVRATQERMKELGLLGDDNWLSLDQWEIAREHVVLNRKLGIGAFGTVYGGEARISDSWVAVAVKTLKMGSNTEDKLDFLSEAETMKRFEHKNIVKLLGVCTCGEPAYMIMEFMLHGDLKTFLLARRQLVGQTSKEAEDVSAENLTRMALDIAYGLQYLRDLHYIHRDLACRNCLLDASKVVKLGDFGMAKPIYDSDYYRLNKRGMLPVRWMAPESLCSGVFTHKSDIWSYGVVLYEILTFSNIPYQGFSNKQVVEYIKAGSIIQLPKKHSEFLRKQLLACWNFDPEGRPTVDDLIEMLVANPTLAKPCLDTPSSAVNPAEAHDHHVLSRLRHRSGTGDNQVHLPHHSTSGFFSHALPLPPDPFHLLHNRRSPIPNTRSRPMSDPSNEIEVSAMLEWCWQTKGSQVVEQATTADAMSLTGVSTTGSPSHPTRQLVTDSQELHRQRLQQ